ncbi:hypothetical protein SEVIR_8G036800v4 [Setaria viridis]|uniref:Uncharacterized protein n=1 Tax=Setaria viridis TaxID=4556 RepID=A0A4U6TEC1_SETVI|nr:uncharacterized protein LOC117866962 [Setaria viridis]TKV99343.1 hypothetical protein SEVIR_8G036800v2 [Setaria viridis]
MVTAVVESPLRQRQRLRSPLGSSGGGGGDFEFRHWRPVKRVTGMRRRWAPPEIEIPNGHGVNGGAGGGGPRGSYTSLRDIMSSPEYAKQQAASSPDEATGSCGDVHMIRHPLVKHAAYAYLQLTPAAREEKARLRRRRGPLCRLVEGCLGFVGALFGR